MSLGLILLIGASYYFEGRAQRSIGRDERGLAEYNALIMEMEAEYQLSAAKVTSEYMLAAAEREALYAIRITEQEAEYALEAAGVERALHEREGERFKARQRAVVAAQGGTFEGSYLDVLARTAEDIEFEGLMIEHEGEMGAWRARETGTELAWRAREAGRLGAHEAIEAGKIGAWRARTSAGQIRYAGDLAERQARLREWTTYLRGGTTLLLSSWNQPSSRTPTLGSQSPYTGSNIPGV
jgi:hypothetical protein